MPAAAVIPAPIAYIKVVAVKKLVVGLLLRWAGPHILREPCSTALAYLSGYNGAFNRALLAPGAFTLRKLECSPQATVLNTLAWNNNIGPWCYFCWFLVLR